MSNPVLLSLTQQIERADPRAEWVTVACVEHANRSLIWKWHQMGYEATAQIKHGINQFWNRCEAKGWQVMPAYQGPLLEDKSETTWATFFYVDRRTRGLVQNKT